MEDTQAAVDLKQRNYVIGGVNGFDFVQQADNLDVPSENELVVLQVNGIPVYVNPTLIQDTMMAHDLKMTMKITSDEVDV